MEIPNDDGSAIVSARADGNGGDVGEGAEGVEGDEVGAVGGEETIHQGLNGMVGDDGLGRGRRREGEKERKEGKAETHTIIYRRGGSGDDETRKKYRVDESGGIIRNVL